MSDVEQKDRSFPWILTLDLVLPPRHERAEDQLSLSQRGRPATARRVFAQMESSSVTTSAAIPNPGTST